MEKQGPHVDPKDPAYVPPDAAAMPPRYRDAMGSEEQEIYRASLQLKPEMPIRQSILDDLSTYYDMSPEECVDRCINWERWSVEEWNARDRTTPEGIADFYRTVRSWSFDLLWYAYLQAEGALYPVSVVATRSLGTSLRGRRVLDFGSGVGATAHFLTQLGCKVDLADISTPLLSFARFRLERRAVRVGYLNLNEVDLPGNEYDVIFAIDTLVHVPDLREVVAKLHRALKPGGLLFTNFDTRPPSPENSWHLYSDDLPLRWIVHRAGFEQRERLDAYLIRYQQVQQHGLVHGIRGLRDMMLLRGPIRRTYRSVRHRLRPRPSTRRPEPGTSKTSQSVSRV